MKKIIIIGIELIITSITVALTLKHLYKKNKIELTLSKENIEVYEKLELKDLINEEINLLNNQEINTEYIGKQNLEIEYKNKIFRRKRIRGRCRRKI